MIDVANPTAVIAEAERRQRLLAQGKRTFDAPDPAPVPELSPRDVTILEKQIEADGDRLMQELGFDVIRFSHPGKTRQTEGIADRRYYRRPRVVERADGRFHVLPLVVWVEYKSATGKQRPGQKLFQELVEDCGEHYVLGGLDALMRWLVSRGLGTVRNGTFEPNPLQENPKWPSIARSRS